MSVFPLPPVPNFRVAQGSPGFVRLNWAHYPLSVKDGHQLSGFRIYRSTNKDELGQIIADERLLDANTSQFDDTDPQAGPSRNYVCVAVEESGLDSEPFGLAPFGSPNTNGLSLFPFNQRVFGSPLQGYGRAPFNELGYGI